jgi:hypothetical protein
MINVRERLHRPRKGEGDSRNLLAVLVEADTGRRSTVATSLNGTNTNDVGVDGAGDAVVNLEVELGENVLCTRVKTTTID